MVENKDKKVLNVPNLRFPEFQGEWKKCKLGDVCNTSTGNKNTQDKTDDGIYPFYVRSQTVERINSWTFDGEAILTAGDGVGVGKVFHHTYGKIGVHQRVYILSDFKCDANYLFHFFSSKFYNRVKRMSAKNSVDSVRKEMITDMPLSLPCCQEQIKIGYMLSILDERIATQNKIIEDLKMLRSAIIEREYHQDSSKLSCIGDAIVQTSKRNKTGVLHNVLSVSNIHGFVKQSEQFEDRNIASEDTSNYKIVERNEFAFNPARINVGSIARLMTYENGIVSPMYICFRTKDCLQPEYLEYFFETKQFVFEMRRRLEGSVRQCLSFDGLCNIPFIIPIMEQQQRIEQHISVLTQKIQLENDILRLLHEQKSGLLNQMFI
ncbi:MAG: restriction endonuclease subunit S [Prevotella conceptionensis]